MLANPIPMVREAVAERPFGVRWEMDPVFCAAFENQATCLSIVKNPTPEDIKFVENFIPTMAGFPFRINGYLPEGTAVLLDKDHHPIKILRLGDSHA